MLDSTPKEAQEEAQGTSVGAFSREGVGPPSGEAPARSLTLPRDAGGPPDEDGPWFFAWVPPEETVFDESVHARVDEYVFSVNIEHKEGDNPTATLEIENPGVGLLASGRLGWMWISKKKQDNTVVPLFFGALMSVPSDMLQTVVTITLVARAPDQDSRKLALAQTLKVPPYYDEVWVEPSRGNDPDAVLDGYSARWHFDRTTLDVTISDVLEGEDGTLEFGYDDLFWDGMNFTLDNVPLSAVSVRATVHWQQRAIGTINLPAFNFSSYTGDGFISDWPKPYSSLGGGWSTGESNIVDVANTSNMATITRSFSWKNHAAKHADGDTMSVNTSETIPAGPGQKCIISHTDVRVVGTGSLPPAWNRFGDLIAEPIQGKAASRSIDEAYYSQALWILSANLELRYAADRARKELINFTLAPDIQEVLVAPGNRGKTNSDLITVNGRDVGQPLSIRAILHGPTGSNVSDGDQVLILSDPPYRFQSTLTPGEGHVHIGATLEESLTNLVNAINANGQGEPGVDHAEENKSNVDVFATLQAPDSVLLTALSDNDKILVETTSAVLEFDAPSTWTWIGGNPYDGQVVTVAGIPYTFNANLKIALAQLTITQTIVRQIPYHVQINLYSTEGTLINFAAAINAEGGAGPNYSIGTIQNPAAQAEIINGVLTVFPRHANANMLTTMAGPWTLATDHLVPDQDTIPIVDVSRRAYFVTSRGQLSIQALICQARAKLRISTRAVKAAFVTELEKGFDLTLRKNVVLNDPRFAGGQAMGKLISYYLKCSGDDGGELAGGEIGCAVGNGNAVSDDPGTPTYVDAGYADPGWQMYSSQKVHLGDEDLWYTPPVDTPIIDDGLVFPLTYQNSVLRKGMFGKPDDQQAALQKVQQTPISADALSFDQFDSEHAEQNKEVQANSTAAVIENFMLFELVLTPLDGGPYSTRYEVALSDLMIPKQVDLGAE